MAIKQINNLSQELTNIFLNKEINNQSGLISAYLNRMDVKHLRNPNVDFLFELTTKHMLAFDGILLIYICKDKFH